MGSYLSQPVTDKVTDDSTFNSISAGEASMQGWRIAQEDAHNLILDFDAGLRSSLFAIFDGHGGAEVAQLAAQRLPEMLLCSGDYADDLVAALENTFVQFDRHLLQAEVLKLLTSMAGVQSDNEDEDQPTAESKTESVLLNEDARIPLNQLLAQYNVKIAKKNGKPILSFNGKKDNSLKESGDSKITMNGELDEGTSKRHFASIGSKSPVNGSGSGAGGSVGSGAGGSGAGGSGAGGSGAGGSGAGGSGAGGSGAGGSRSVAGGSGACGGSSNGAGGSGACGGSSNGAGSSSVGTSATMDAGGDSSNTKCEKDLNENAESEEEEDDEDEEIDSEEDYLDEDDDDSDKEDDSDDDDDDDEEEEDSLVPFNAMQSSGEAGYDSGCTAVVAVLRGSTLYVANAGDSRCVVSRSGIAVAMSEDHKPEDKQETDRIKAAGGYVSKDGRVNSSLNLSRALGDHAFKSNRKLPLVDQMISCLPDIRSLDLDKRDEFIILACDGIWNVMSNQEVVTFVRDKMATVPTPKLSEVCSMLFDYCIAPNTSGDCIGCDNMSAVIVDLRNSGDLSQISPKESTGDQTLPQKFDDDVVLQKSKYVKVIPEFDDDEDEGEDESEEEEEEEDDEEAAVKDALAARLEKDGVVEPMNTEQVNIVIEEEESNEIENMKTKSTLDLQGPQSKKIKIDP